MNKYKKLGAPMVRMHCKSPLLQHPFTKCHIITLREMQKIKNVHTPNQIPLQANPANSQKTKNKK